MSCSPMCTNNSMYVLFFFSSRRRHTRLVSDWSSDVCSSDLYARDDKLSQAVDVWEQVIERAPERAYLTFDRLSMEIGRASCRERVEYTMVAGAIKNKKHDTGVDYMTESQTLRQGRHRTRPRD